MFLNMGIDGLLYKKCSISNNFYLYLRFLEKNDLFYNFFFKYKNQYVDYNFYFILYVV